MSPERCGWKFLRMAPRQIAVTLLRERYAGHGNGNALARLQILYDEALDVTQINALSVNLLMVKVDIGAEKLGNGLGYPKCFFDFEVQLVSKFPSGVPGSSQSLVPR